MLKLNRLFPLALFVILVGLVPAAVRAASGDAPSTAPAGPTSLPVLNGFVGPGYDIALLDSQGDLRGRQIPAGTYQVRITDYSTIHNFELKGAGVDVETEEEFVGQVTWT